MSASITITEMKDGSIGVKLNLDKSTHEESMAAAEIVGSFARDRNYLITPVMPSSDSKDAWEFQTREHPSD